MTGPPPPGWRTAPGTATGPYGGTRPSHATLGSRWTQSADALGAGDLNLAQARVIVEALDAFPTSWVSTLSSKRRRTWSNRQGCSGRGSCATGPRGPRAPGPRGRGRGRVPRLLAEETRAQAATRLDLRPRGDGSTDLRARIPDHVANRLRTYLDAFASPRRTPLGEVDALPVSPPTWGKAFVAFLENVPDAGLPTHGGTTTSVMVTLDLDTLLTGIGTATTSTGDRITAEQARRLACQARIIPVVLGRKGEVLDLGRSARLFSPAQRKALAIRDTRVHHRRLLDPRRLVRSPPLATTLVPRRPHRPRRRQAALLVPPPPRPRPRLAGPPPPQRGHDVPPANVRWIASSGA